MGISVTGPRLPYSKDTRLVFFNRIPPEQPDRFFSLQKQYGFRYIMDLDDYWHLYPHHYIAPNWERSGMANRLIRFMKGAYAVTTTTTLLADKIREYNQNVHVVPNALPFDSGQFTSARLPSDRLRFIYAGGSSHLHDFKILEEPLKAIPGINFTLAGYNEDGQHREQWQRMATLVPGARVVKKQPLSSYMSVYDNADVALVPLEGNLFNSCKSNLKVLEAGCKYMAIMASQVLPYNNEIDREFLMYADTSIDWIRGIRGCINNPGYAHEMGLRLGEHVRTHYHLERVNEYRKQLFDHYLNK
jgi:hypothetical protein